MKNIKQILPVIIGCFVAFTAFGQEYDDMYFNSKDRYKQNEGKISADLGFKNTTGVADANSPINPTDSYSARNINPEYASQINTSSNQVIEDDYFIQDFQPTGVNSNLSNCNCSSGSYYNPYYGNNSFNNPYSGYGGGFGSPFNNYYNSPWGYPSYGGFSPGLSMSLGYGWGGFSPGIYGGMGYGYGSYGGSFMNPYAFNPWGGSYYGSYYPRQIIVVNNGDAVGTRVSYSKRSSRSSNINQVIDNSRPGFVGNVTNTGRSTVNSGRNRSATPEYYDRSWKRNQDTNPTRGYWSNTTGSNGSNNSNSFFDRGNSNTNGRQGSSGFSSPSRNSFNSGGINSGGSRSGSSGSSSGAKTRSRNN